ncbi:hypothetical protein HY496_00360 [Candidatus Woesearchaeota archaeon]|nr:hypothetical protein [Candidatus Woesearchaeota archaeon]
MSKLRILNSREVKVIKEQLRQQFGYALEEQYAYLQNEKERVFVVNRDLANLDLEKLRIDRVGLYFAELRPSQVRLSKEGAQLLFNEARKNGIKLKNVITLTKIETRAYFAGVDLKKDLGEENRLIILTYEEDVIGCASYKEGKILNYLPKTHRGEVIL